MGIGQIVLCASLMLVLHARGSSMQTAETKRDGNLHPGRVILYRPVASNHDGASREERRTKSEHSRRYTWDRDRTNRPTFNQEDSRTEENRPRHWDKEVDNPHNRDKERDRPYNLDKEANSPYNRDKERDRPYNLDKEVNSPYNRDKERERPYNQDKERDRPYNRDRERDRPYNRDKEQDHPYNRDKERDRPYNRDRERDRRPARDDGKDKQRDNTRSGFPSDASSFFRPQRYDERKLPASKYTNDYFQPPRPTPDKQIQNRNSFLFPGDSYWPHRAVAQYNNVADYLPRERHRFQNSLGYTGDHGGFKQHRPRPALLQASIPIIPGSGIIVASGPGGVRHVIHDLRVPVQHTHVHHDREKIQQTEPFRVVGHSFPSGGDNNPYSNINQAYKGVPIYIQGGTFTAKEYDPRFVALYRQVLEENQKKILPIKEKTQGGFLQGGGGGGGFQSSPTYEWFSEPDPLYHPRDSALLTLPHLQLTTGLAAFDPAPITAFQSTVGSVELVGGTGTDFLGAQIHSAPTGFEETPTTPMDEQLRPPTEPPNTSSSPSELRGVQHSDPNSTTPEEQPTTRAPARDSDIYRLSSPFVPEETPPTEAPPPTQAPPPDPLDEVISTSISHSVSAIRLTRQRDGSNASELLETSQLTQKREQLAETTTTQDPTNQSTPQGSAETTTEDRTTSMSEDSSTMTEPNEITTETLSNTSQETQRAQSLNEVKPKADVRDLETTTTLDNEREATTTTLTETTESNTSDDMTTTPNEAQTEPTTSASELALTTLNYLVLSLVNQVRASTILSDNATTTLPTSQET